MAVIREFSTSVRDGI
jgi:hypothetical protein